jgi:hypothetical protein
MARGWNFKFFKKIILIYCKLFKFFDNFFKKKFKILNKLYKVTIPCMPPTLRIKTIILSENMSNDLNLKERRQNFLLLCVLVSLFYLYTNLNYYLIEWCLVTQFQKCNAEGTKKFCLRFSWKYEKKTSMQTNFYTTVRETRRVR